MNTGQKVFKISGKKKIKLKLHFITFLCPREFKLNLINILDCNIVHFEKLSFQATSMYHVESTLDC